jgi:hypothetical protein
VFLVIHHFAILLFLHFLLFVSVLILLFLHILLRLTFSPFNFRSSYSSPVSSSSHSFPTSSFPLLIPHLTYLSSSFSHPCFPLSHFSSSLHLFPLIRDSVIIFHAPRRS